MSSKKTSRFYNVQKKGGEKMKKIISLMALVVLFAVPAMALNIKTSKHNLGTTGDYAYKSTNETQICIFCHTPHNAAPNIPLWNRNNPTASNFKLYTSSSTLNIATADKANLSTDSISLFCLSCHDGATALNSIQNPSSIGTPTMPGSGKIGGKAKLGTDLTNDHPVNFNFDVARTNEGGAASTLKDRATMVGMKFFKSAKGTGTAVDGYVECASCHEVHGAGFKKFLRKSNDSSSLCLTCHNK